MESQAILCGNCSNQIPARGFFCGVCLVQIRCKKCDSLLEIDYIGCTNCGTAKEIRSTEDDNKVPANTNSIRINETLTERTIEATFSDNVGKDLAGILRDAYSAKLLTGTKDNLIKHIDKDITDSNDEEFYEADILDNEDQTILDTKTQKTSSSEYPTLKAIAMKNLPSSETEWIVVYAFYASAFGVDIFTRKQIIEKYVESNRFNKTTTNRDLATNIKRAVQQGFLNPLQSGFSILDNGVQKAKEIISRTGSSSPRIMKRSSSNLKESGQIATSKKNTKNNTLNRTHKRLADIDFYPKGNDSLESFYGKYSVKNDHERNLLFVYFMQEILKISDISYDHIYTCYDTLSLRVPENLQQIVRNTKSKTGWISKEGDGFRVTVKGGNQIKAWNAKR